jgi:hypothetical protein
MASEVDVQGRDSSKIVIHKEQPKLGEIEGFSHASLRTAFTSVKAQFESLVSEGTTGYDVIVDKEECKVYSREAEEGYVLKYTWLVPYPALKFKEFMDRVDLRKTWDANIDVLDQIGKFTENEAITYTKYKKFLTFDPRETLAYTTSTKIFNNLADVTFSVESEKYPIESNIVRVKLYVAGLYLESIPEDEKGNLTKVTCFSHMDVGLPKNLNNIARKFAGTTIPPLTKKINTQMKKFVESQEG